MRGAPGAESLEERKVVRASEQAGPNESNLSETDGQEVRERKRINLRKIRLSPLLLATASLFSGVSCGNRVSNIFYFPRLTNVQLVSERLTDGVGKCPYLAQDPGDWRFNLSLNIGGMEA